MTYKTKNIQACLDLLLLHQGKNYSFLEEGQLILVKDSFTADMGELHYANQKVILKVVKPSAIKVYVSEKTILQKDIPGLNL